MRSFSDVMLFLAGAIACLFLRPTIAGAQPITVAGSTFDAGEQAFADNAFLVSGSIRLCGDTASIADALSANNTFEAAGGLPIVNLSFSEYAANILATNATKAQGNESSLETQQQLLNSLKLKSDNLRGVNLDEELTNLILFEQAFSAAARVISVIQNMFDALDRIV